MIKTQHDIPLKVVCFLWRDPLARNRHIYTYGLQHVRSLWLQVRKNLSVPHEFVCVTDYSQASFDFCRTVELRKTTHIPGTRYAKLQLFAPEAAQLIGRRILYLDLDTVITGNIDAIVKRPEELVLWRNPNFGIPRRARYNTSIMLLTAGARTEFWFEFIPERTPAMLAQSWGGTDQAWISHRARPNEAHWTDTDGIYGAGRIGDHDPHKCTQLPQNARIVFFPGKREPHMPEVQQRHPWIKEHLF